MEDRGRLKDLYTQVQRTWFPDGPDDPHITLVRFDAEHARRLLGRARRLASAESGVLKAMVTGTPGANGNAGIAEL